MSSLPVEKAGTHTSLFSLQTLHCQNGSSLVGSLSDICFILVAALTFLSPWLFTKSLGWKLYVVFESLLISIVIIILFHFVLRSIQGVGFGNYKVPKRFESIVHCLSDRWFIRILVFCIVSLLVLGDGHLCRARVAAGDCYVQLRAREHPPHGNVYYGWCVWTCIGCILLVARAADDAEHDDARVDVAERPDENHIRLECRRTCQCETSAGHQLFAVVFALGNEHWRRVRNALLGFNSIPKKNCPIADSHGRNVVRNKQMNENDCSTMVRRRPTPMPAARAEQRISKRNTGRRNGQNRQRCDGERAPRGDRGFRID